MNLNANPKAFPLMNLNANPKAFLLMNLNANAKAFPLMWGRCHDEGVTDEVYTPKSGTLFADGLFCGRELCMRL